MKFPIRFPGRPNFSFDTSRCLSWIKRFIGSNFFFDTVAKVIFTIAIMTVALIPTWIYLTIRWLTQPDDFWQEFAIFAVCGLAIGWLQVIMLLVGGGLALRIILEDF